MPAVVFEAFSLTEWLIFGFICANLAIIAVCLTLNGFKRLTPPADD